MWSRPGRGSGTGQSRRIPVAVRRGDVAFSCHGVASGCTKTPEWRSDCERLATESVARVTVVSRPKPNRYRGPVPLPSLGRLSTRTALKAVSTGKHRNAPAKAEDELVEDHELTSYLAALAPDADPESTGTGRRFGEAQVYQLRLSQIASEQLKDIAAERGSSPHAIAQEWILERLSWEGQAASAQRNHRQVAPVAPPVADRRDPRARRVEDHTDQHFFGQRWEQPPAVRGQL